jgi:VWFA-related protein
MLFHKLIPLFLIVTLLTPVIGQTNSDVDEDVVRITTNLVQTDVIVTDKKGNLVTDLKVEDFEIFENGKPQPITNFSFILAETQPTPPKTENKKDKTADKDLPPVPAARLRPEQVRRTIALIVDDLGLSYESIYFARRALKKFVDEQMQPGDLVAVMRTSAGAGALQQFTSDKRQLYAAIELLRWYPQGRGGLSAFAPIEQSNQEPIREGQDPESLSDFATFREESNEDFNRFRDTVFIRGTLGAIRYVVNGLKDLPGRKSVVLLSDGIQLFGRDADNDGIVDYVRSLTDQANRAAVTLYTMDVRGLQVLGITAADDTGGLSTQGISDAMSTRSESFFRSQDGLDYLAKETGGLFIHNTNDIAGGIKDILKDQKGYYLLGYRPDESTFDRKGKRTQFNKIKITVKRPGLRVRHRAGFYGIEDDERKYRPRTRNEQLFAAITSPFSSGELDMRLTSFFVNDAKDGSYLRSALYLDATKLTFTKELGGTYKATLDIVGETFGEHGQPIQGFDRVFPVRVTEDKYRNILKNGLIFNINVPIKKAGAYQYRVAVRDAATERIGSASQFIEVPDIKKDRLALSGLVAVGSNPIKKTVSKNSGDGSATNVKISAEEGVVAEADPQAHLAIRNFRRGMWLDYICHVYNTKIDKATKQPKVTTQMRLFRDGKLIFTGKEQPLNMAGQPDLKRLIAYGRIQLGLSMEPGEYVLQLVVTDTLAKKNRISTQWVNFNITG